MLSEIRRRRGDVCVGGRTRPGQDERAASRSAGVAKLTVTVHPPGTVAAIRQG